MLWLVVELGFSTQGCGKVLITDYIKLKNQMHSIGEQIEFLGLQQCFSCSILISASFKSSKKNESYKKFSEMAWENEPLQFQFKEFPRLI